MTTAAMRRALGAALAAAVLVLAGCSSSPTAPQVAKSDVDVNTPALVQAKAAAGIATCPTAGGTSTTSDLPDLTLPCLGGGPSVDLQHLKGPLVINLWQYQCGPCRKELPALAAFDRQYGDQVPVLGIDWVDINPADAIGLLKKSGVTYPQLADPGGTLLEQPDFPLQPASPQFILVAADGTITKTAGGLSSVAEVKDLVEQHLGVSL